MLSVSLCRAGLLVVLVLAVLSPSVSGATIPDHIMKDPSFLQCLAQHSTSDPVDYVNIVATCYGFVGRPRFGKRFDPLQLQHYRPEVDYDWA